MAQRLPLVEPRHGQRSLYSSPPLAALPFPGPECCTEPWTPARASNLLTIMTPSPPLSQLWVAPALPHLLLSWTRPPAWPSNAVGTGHGWQGWGLGARPPMPMSPFIPCFCSDIAMTLAGCAAATHTSSLCAPTACLPSVSSLLPLGW